MYKEIMVVIILLLAIYDDIKHGKIKNMYTLPGALIGFVLMSFNDGILQASGAFFGTFVIVLIFFAFNVIGGGDGKLLLAIATMLGFSYFIGTFSYSIILGGIYNAFTYKTEDVKKEFTTFLNQIKYFLLVRGIGSFRQKKKVKFALIIAAGAVVNYFLPLTSYI